MITIIFYTETSLFKPICKEKTWIFFSNHIFAKIRKFNPRETPKNNDFAKIREN